VCRNPLLGEERARKRDELLAATEQDLARIRARVLRTHNPLRGAAAIGQALAAVFGQRKMAKHFDIAITDDTFSFSRNQAAKAALDGIYVVHQSAGRVVRCRCDRARLQRPRRCRACLPFDENRRSGTPPCEGLSSLIYATSKRAANWEACRLAPAQGARF
jgi:hypothetical protein